MSETKKPIYVPKPRIIDGWHYELTCLNCKSNFHAKRISAKFCSDTCRIMYHYRKNRPDLIQNVRGTVSDQQLALTKVIKKESGPAPRTFFTKGDLRDYLYKKYERGITDSKMKIGSERTIRRRIKGERAMSGLTIKRISFYEYSLTQER